MKSRSCRIELVQTLGDLIEKVLVPPGADKDLGAPFTLLACHVTAKQPGHLAERPVTPNTAISIRLSATKQLAESCDQGQHCLTQFPVDLGITRQKKCAIRSD
ncbi:hypothetical protein ASF05_15225 [Aeromicrobium sp. Leaf245]|nr:hypothetical protein ASF05_15225 [Aeromicrobium sp. Leaf245]